MFAALPKELPRLISVGRLDLDSEGLLLLTNDGALARRLELPATGWVRRYKVRVHGEVDPARLAALAKGVRIDGVAYGPIRAELERAQGSNAWIAMALSEGKNREVRRVLEHLGPAGHAADPAFLRPVPARPSRARVDRRSAAQGARRAARSRDASLGRACGSSAVGIAAAASRRRSETRSGRPATEPARRCSTSCRTAASPRAACPFADAAVLDAFAGTGALGLEALSRGAAEAFFIERDREALAVLRRNIEILGETARSRIVAGRRHPPTARCGRLRARLSRPALRKPARRAGIGGSGRFRLAHRRRARRGRNRRPRGGAAAGRVCAARRTRLRRGAPHISVPGGRAHSTSWVWVTSATSRPSGVETRVCQTIVRRPR